MVVLALPVAQCLFQVKRPRLWLALPLLLWHAVVVGAYVGLGYVIVSAIENMIQSANTYWLCEVFIVLVVMERIKARCDAAHWVIHGMQHELVFFDQGRSGRIYNAIGALLEECHLGRSLLTVCPVDLWRIEHHSFVKNGVIYGGSSGALGYLFGVISIKFVPPDIWRGELLHNTSKFELRAWRSVDLDAFLSECLRVAGQRQNEEGLLEPLLYKRRPTTIPEADFENL